MDYSNKLALQQIRKLNTHRVMNALEFINYKVTEEELLQQIMKLTNHSKESVKKELKRTLHHGVSNGFIMKDGDKYSLPSVTTSYQVDTKNVTNSLQSRCAQDSKISLTISVSQKQLPPGRALSFSLKIPSLRQSAHKKNCLPQLAASQTCPTKPVSSGSRAVRLRTRSSAGGIRKRLPTNGVRSGLLAKGPVNSSSSAQTISSGCSVTPSGQGSSQLRVSNRFVRDAITKNKVGIFSKTTCPYCEAAKKQFQMLDVPILSLELNKRSDVKEIIDDLEKITGIRTVPQVFIKGKFIGNGTEVEKLGRTGKLKAMLN